MNISERLTAEWFAIADSLDQVTGEAACRGALVAQRARLVEIQIDLVSDSPWPADVTWAVDALGARAVSRRSRLFPWVMREPDFSHCLDPRRDEDFELALALGPYTICGNGYADGSDLLWTANDTGTSVLFKLTADELASVQEFVAAVGGDPGALIPWTG